MTKEIWEEHDRLYHYTGESGLFGILESQCLHATHYSALNDATEIYQARDKLRSTFDAMVRRMVSGAHELTKVSSADGWATTWTHEFIELLYGLFRKELLEAYIVSMCGHPKGSYESANGLLSQWRGYGGKTAYAIVFRTKELVDLLGTTSDSIEPFFGLCGNVFYENNDDNSFVKEFDNLLRAAQKDIPNWINKKIIPLDLLKAFMECVVRYKHQAFREEQEVRIVFFPVPESPVPQRCTRPDFTPFVRICDAGSKGAELPIETILVGPSADSDVRRDAILRYVKMRKLQIEVRCSGTPLRQ